MSKRYWNSAGERRLLRSLGISTYITFLLARQAQLKDNVCYDFDIDSDEEFLLSRPNLSIPDPIPLVLTICTLLQNAEVYKHIEDVSIEWERRLCIVDFNESQCIDHFRFKRVHLIKLFDALWPILSEFLDGDRNCLRTGNRYNCPYETAMLILLYRFSRPRRIRPDMEEFFGMRKSHISDVLKMICDGVYQLSYKYLNNPVIFRNRIPLYARKINEKCGVVEHAWGFIDGTIRKTCRPTYFQREVYSGHKRCHGIKFQSVLLPDGLVGCLWGPMNGRRHDSYMLRESNLLQQLSEFMPPNLEIVYYLYGDPAYPQSRYLIGGYRYPVPGTPQAAFNTTMSRVRESVEWGFKEISKQWSFLDFKDSMKKFKMPIGQYYQIGAFLSNLRSLFYDNQTSTYFDMDTMTLNEYLSLIDILE